MNRSVACALVTIWARAYTLGLPAGDRDARLEEIASDLWESAQDAERPSTTVDVLSRWLGGVPDDVRWRAARATLRDVTGLALATTAVAVAIWIYAALLGPQMLPPPHGQPLRFVSETPAAAVPPSPPPGPPR